MGEQRTTIERRQLGAELRRIRVAAGRSQAEVAAVIDCTASRISRIEGGDRSLKAVELRAVLDFLGVRGARHDEVMRLGQQARARQRRRVYSDALPGAFRRLGDLEEMATEVYYSAGEIVPGMLQTEDYAHALIRNAMSALSFPADEVEARVRFRLERQELLDRESPPHMWFVVGEPALRRPVGSVAVLRGQLAHLLDVVDRYPRVALQVVPLSAVDHPLLDGSITIFRFDGRGNDVVHQPTVIGGGVYLDDEESAATCLRAYDRLRAVALGPARSRDFLARCAKEIAR